MSLQGTLRTLGITEVLEFLAERNATGRLDITADSGYATYWVLRGEVATVDFDFDREGGSDAAEATYYALTELDGTFLFDEGQSPDHNVDTESVTDVLARTADIADAWSDVEDLIPTPQYWLTRTKRFTKAITVEPEWWTAIDAVADGCSSHDLAVTLKMRALSASTMAAEMTRAGILEVGEPRIIDDVVPQESLVVATPSEAVEIDETAVTESTYNEMYAEEPGEVAALAEHDDDIVASEPVMADYDAATHSSSDSVAADILSSEDPIPEQVVDSGLFGVDEASLDEMPVVIPDISAILPPYDTEPLPTEDPAVAAQELEAAVQELAAMAEDTPEDHAWPVDGGLSGASPAINWAEPDALDTESAAAVFETTSPSFEPEDLGDDDGWASDHSQQAPPTYAPLDESLSAPTTDSVPEGGLRPWGATPQAEASAAPQPESPFSTPAPTGGLFGSAPAVDDLGTDLAYMPAPDSSLPSEPEVDEPEVDEPEDGSFGTDDRSSVLKFLRRD